MGNRDKRGREKKKPKKQEVKTTYTPARPTTVYKPTTPPPASTPEQNS
jgi:hypothetical protein